MGRADARPWWLSGRITAPLRKNFVRHRHTAPAETSNHTRDWRRMMGHPPLRSRIDNRRILNPAGTKVANANAVRMARSATTGLLVMNAKYKLPNQPASAKERNNKNSFVLQCGFDWEE